MEDKEEKYLFLDDIRHNYDAFNYTNKSMFLQKKWVIVRNYEEFVQYITNNGMPDFISFDHDLADEHYDHDNIQDYKEKTGLECAKWLVDYCIDNNVELPGYFCHSQNPVGKDNIIGYLENYQKSINI